MNAAIAASLRQGAALHSRGELAPAIAIYADILKKDPQQPDALHLLGVALTQTGEPRRGAELIEKSLASNPAQPAALANLGNAQLALRSFETARANFERAIELAPDYAPAHNGNGSALAALERHEAALASFDAALRLAPGFQEAACNRGLTLFALARFSEAIAELSRALAWRPTDAKAMAGRAAALHAAGRWTEALADCDRALQLAPALHEALMQRARTLQALKRHADAIGAYERVLAQRPDDADALLALATLAMTERRFEQAVHAFGRLLQLSPERDFVRGALLHARLQLFDWDGYAGEVARIVADLDAGAAPDQPLSLLAISDSPERQQRCALRLVERLPPVVELPPPARRAARTPRRLRIAYVSADFLEHPLAFLMAGLFAAHDRDRFEVTAFSLRADALSPTARRLQGACERFIDVSMRSDEQIAALIREHEIDVAVDLMGYTAENRPQILRARPAPLQVNYLGFPATMGAPHIDYLFADRFVIPPQEARHYSEHIVYLADCFQANDAARAPAAAAVTRQQAGLPEVGFVWCSFHGSYKINPDLLDVWSRLLHAVPGSVLWLVAGSGTARANLLREAAVRGLGPERFVFAANLPYPAHLARLPLADLCLDTWPFNGGATSSDALWTGVPVVTRAGRAFASRMSGSLLATVGLDELVTHDWPAYERVALRLASQPEELARVRRRLTAARSTSPLFDTQRIRRQIEAAYVAIWEHHERGESPTTFSQSPHLAR